jgi:hypothetical protein
MVNIPIAYLLQIVDISEQKNYAGALKEKERLLLRSTNCGKNWQLAF